MFDKQRITELLNHARAGYTLPQPFYRDADIYEFDVAGVFSQAWMMLGFEAELPEPGCYLSLTIGPNPILIVRGRDNVIRGFHNICRHRGAQICAEGTGKAARIVCPYHKWTYELDGRLVGAARMPAELDFEQHGLVPIRIELLEGCIYGALSSVAPDFAPFREAATPFLRPYGLAKAKLAHQSVLLEKANWKLVMENARECYHCAAWHPELKVAFPVVFSGGLTVTDTSRHESYLATMRQLELPVGPAAGPWWHVGRYPLNPGVTTVSPDGNALVTPQLLQTGGAEIGGLRWATEPNSFCHAFADYAFMFTVLPLGPEESRVVSKWLVARDAREGIDFHIPALTEVWTATNLQDRDLAENNQRGINGIGYRPGPYAHGAEDLVIRFNDWYRAAAARALTAA